MLTTIVKEILLPLRNLVHRPISSIVSHTEWVYSMFIECMIHTNLYLMSLIDLNPFLFALKFQPGMHFPHLLTWPVHRTHSGQVPPSPGRLPGPLSPD